jgi:hypothetical protein
LFEMSDARICFDETMTDTSGPAAADTSAVQAVTKVIVRTSMSVPAQDRSAR